MSKPVKINTSKTLTTLACAIVLVISAYGAVGQILPRKHFSEKPALTQIASPTLFSSKLEVLSPENIGKLQEIFLLPQEKDNMIVALTESQNRQELLVVDAAGAFYRWDLDSQTIVASFSLFSGQPENSLSPGQLTVPQINAGISFSKDRRFVITPSEVRPDTIYGLNLWNLDLAQRLYCRGTEELCPEWGPGDDTNTSLSLHPTRDMYFTSWHGRGVYGWYGFGDKGEWGNLSLFSVGDDDPSITRVAVDPLGDYLAAVDEKGVIQIGDLSQHKQPMQDEEHHGFSASANYHSWNILNDVVNTIDLKFDETHSWLGWLTEENLVVWSLEDYVLPQHFKTELVGGKVISFDHTGKFLAVASQGGVEIFDVNEKAKIAEYPLKEVTALYFSGDNRLLILGDMKGNIHLWGIPQE